MLTDGSGSGSPSPGCNYSSATHTVKSYNMLGGTGGWVTGSQGYMTSYLTAENDQQITGDPNSGYEFDWGGEVICSVFGTVFSNAGFGTVGESVGNFANSGPGGIYQGGCLFKLSCPNGTTSRCAPPSVSDQGSDCTYPYDHEYYLTWTPSGGATECFSLDLGFVSTTPVDCK